MSGAISLLPLYAFVGWRDIDIPLCMSGALA